MLFVPIPAVLVYYNDIILRNDGGAATIWNISITEYAVNAFFCFLGEACDGAARVDCINPQMSGNGLSVLVPLLSAAR